MVVGVFLSPSIHSLSGNFVGDSGREALWKAYIEKHVVIS